MRRLALTGLLTLLLAACGQQPARAPAESTSAPETVSAETSGTPTEMPPEVPTEVPTAIPDAFPLTAEMARPGLDDVAVSARTIGMRALDFCGRKPLRGLDPTDRLAAEASGEESATTRDLMLFDEPGRPAAVLADVRAAAAACPAQRTGTGSRLLTEVRDSPLGPGATTVLHTYEIDGAVTVGAEIIDVVRVGRALLVTSAYAEWDPATNLDEGISEQAERLAATVDAMAVFADR